MNSRGRVGSPQRWTKAVSSLKPNFPLCQFKSHVSEQQSESVSGKCSLFFSWLAHFAESVYVPKKFWLGEMLTPFLQILLCFVIRESNQVSVLGSRSKQRADCRFEKISQKAKSQKWRTYLESDSEILYLYWRQVCCSIVAACIINSK